MADYKENTLYDCEVKSQGFMQSKNGTDGFVLVFTPVGEVDREDPTKTYDCEPHDRKIEFWLSEKAVDFSIDKLRALGWQGKSFAELDPARSGGYSFVGETIRLICKHQIGDDGFAWDKFDVPFAAKPIEIENDSRVASKLDSLFGKKLKQPVNGSVKPEPKRQPATVPDDEKVEMGGEDIPF